MSNSPWSDIGVSLQGMGEPLNNYEQVRTATRTMINPALFGLKRSKVTISTVGIIPRILQVQDLRPADRQPSA